MQTTDRNRRVAFAILAAVCAAAAAVSAVVAVLKANGERAATNRSVAAARPKASQILTSGRPFAVFRHTDRAHPATYGQLSIAAVNGTIPGPAVPAGPTCQRAAYAAHTGLCLDLLGTGMAVRV